MPLKPLSSPQDLLTALEYLTMTARALKSAGEPSLTLATLALKRRVEMLLSPPSYPKEMP